MNSSLNLKLTSLIFLGFGLVFLVWPDAINLVAVELPEPIARTEIRAFYGGLEIGIGCFLWISSRRPDWHAPALLIQFLSLGSIAVARILGSIIEMHIDALTAGLTTMEGLGGLLGLYFYRSLQSKN